MNTNRYSILHRHTSPTCKHALSKGLFILNYLADSSDIILVYLPLSGYWKVISKRRKKEKKEQIVSLPEIISFSCWSILYPKYVVTGKPMGKWHCLHKARFGSYLPIWVHNKYSDKTVLMPRLSRVGAWRGSIFGCYLILMELNLRITFHRILIYNCRFGYNLVYLCAHLVICMNLSP